MLWYVESSCEWSQKHRGVGWWWRGKGAGLVLGSSPASFLLPFRILNLLRSIYTILYIFVHYASYVPDEEGTG